jgi:hypothetical protein
VREFYAGAERHLHEVRYVREHDGVFVNNSLISEMGRPLEESGLFYKALPASRCWDQG